ncbi:DEAD/DEAH box helicase [Longispora sp. K20-0274]|uniref:DEAD/DEAH box helicase n=1 Tax=Longispora sp. K20-0274 TaxID=3088255 RepID=UPI003999A220
MTAIDVLASLVRGRTGLVTHVERVPARTGRPAQWPDFVPDEVLSALSARGIERPWAHQADAAAAAWAGRHVVIATGTASGKSLAYQLPVVCRLLATNATALYLSPTKALAADQLRSLTGFDVSAAVYDGDTPRAERDWLRRHGRLLLTNPDMLHHGMLPQHARWAGFLRRLQYVVIDECHTYRGVFGSHVAHVIRRLRRLCARYGASPTFVLASATVSDPAASASRLTGLPVVAVTDDASPRAGVTFALWEPPLLPVLRRGPRVDPWEAASAERPEGAGGREPGLTSVDEHPRGGAAHSAVDELVLGHHGPLVGARLLDGVVDGRRVTVAPRAAAEDGTAWGPSVEDGAVPGPSEELPEELWAVEPPEHHDDSPHHEGPAVGEHGAPVRKTALRETASLLADLVASGVRTLAFVRSRRGAELVATMAKRGLRDAELDFLTGQVAAYRAGYLREERRALEKALRSGDIVGLAATNALELGVDIAGLDAVLLTGYPGTLASLWQQAGRAGRSGQEALCVLVARDDPLDTYLVHHPDALFRRPVEATVLDPGNPYVLGPHLCCAAAELPLTAEDLALFGASEELADGLLRRRPTGWYWTGHRRPTVDLRGTGGEPVAVIETGTGRLLGTIDAGSAHSQVHPGAVYLHQGSSYVVDELDLDDGAALVRAEEPDWSTHARDVTELRIISTQATVDAGPVRLSLGEVDVTSQVVAYQRRRLSSGEVIDERPLDLPERQLRTVAVWYTITGDPVAGIEPADLPGALHAAEHAAIGLLPLIATCDRWDIGGLSTARHQDTDLPTVFVYDGHQGGAGFAERAYAAATDWLTATRQAIAACECPAGCPSCVQSPKCGNGNDPLSKPGALQVLDAVLAALATAA